MCTEIESRPRAGKGHNMTHEEMFRIYKGTTRADGYIIGFIHNHSMYYMTLRELTTDILRNDRESSKRGGKLKIRVYIKAAIRKLWVESGKAVKIGTENLLDMYKGDGYNKGEHFEHFIMESLTGEKWFKDSVPYWEAGDIRLNGEEIQIKFDGAELTNEGTAATALEEMGLARA